MKKFIILLILIIPYFGKAQQSGAGKVFNPKAGISVIGGMQYNNLFKTSAPVYGFEFSMECPLDQGNKNHIRQKISLIRQQGKDYKSLSAEINPQYKLVAKSSFEFGIGPVAGMIFTKFRDNDKPVFTYGMGTGAVYYYKKVFIGIESRYAMTKNISFDKTGNKPEFSNSGSLNSIRTFIKLGYIL